MNIGNRYKAQKENVLDLFNIYKDKRGKTWDGNDIDHLQNRVEALKNGKYTLTVAGEVSSGKSTFINALLGKDILPTGVRQLTSAIVEIVKSESPYLHVEYVDRCDIFGENEILFGELEQLCAIPKKYQSIPTTLLDTLIRRTYDHLIVNDDFISQLEKRSNKKLIQHKKLIQDYIDNRNRDDIPVKIELGYPLSWDFDELSIVDSPGVNALGGVQDITHEYLNNSQAVLFVQNIQQVELQSFREFVDSQISSAARDKETLFLILTHAGLHSDETIHSQTSTARDLYSDIIKPEQIIPVDSLLKIILNDLENEKTLEEIEQDSESKEDAIIKANNKSKKTNISIEEYISEKSRFKILEDAIDNFAMAAPFFQLSEILNAMRDGYQQLELIYNEDISLKEKKAKDPSEFAKAIERIQKELTEWESILKATISDINEKFTGKAEWNKQIDQLKIQYPEKFTNSSSIDEVRTHFQNANNQFEEIIKSYTSNLTFELNKRLTAEEEKFSENHSITLPSIDLNSIEERSREKALETKNKIEKVREKVGERRLWYTLWIKKEAVYEWKDKVVGQEEITNEDKFLSEYKVKIANIFHKISNSILNEKFKKILDSYVDMFKSKTSKIIQDRSDALKEEKYRQQTNTDILQEMQELKTKKKSFYPQIVRIEEIIEDLS